MFNFPYEVTIGDKYKWIETVQTVREAKRMFNACVRHSQTYNKSRKEAISIETQNISYYIGYFDKEVEARIKRLLGISYMFEGATPAALLNIGQRMSEIKSK